MISFKSCPRCSGDLCHRCYPNEPHCLACGHHVVGPVPDFIMDEYRASMGLNRTILERGKGGPQLKRVASRSGLHVVG